MREGRFLAANGTVGYDWHDNQIFFETQNETILVQPSALLYRDLTVHVRLFLEYPTTNDFRWRHKHEQRTVWMQARGPGRVAVQSIFTKPESADRIVDYSYGTTIQRW